MQEENSKEKATAPAIVFDAGEEKRRPANYVDSMRLIRILECGAEPYNNGEGWKVVEPDPNGLGETLAIDESVIRQVRAFGKAHLERTSRGMVLKGHY